MEIAVIGSGPSLAGADLGPVIDRSYDAVIRLFDCAWQNPSDHGAEWTWGLIPGPWRRFDFGAMVAGMSARPARGWMSYHFGEAHRRVPDRTQAIDVRNWNLRLKAIAHRPEIVLTRGFCMFVAAATLRPRRITGYGFDAVRAGKQAGYRYHPGYNAAGFDPERAAARHDAGAERALLRELARETGIDVVLI